MEELSFEASCFVTPRDPLVDGGVGYWIPPDILIDVDVTAVGVRVEKVQPLSREVESSSRASA